MKKLFLCFTFFIAISSFAQYDIQLYSQDFNPILRDDSYENIVVGKQIDSMYWNGQSYWSGSVYSVPRQFFKLNTTQIRNLQDTVDTYGYLKIESDPTISSWAKQPLKPIYGISEISNTNDIYGNLTHHTTTEILAILSPIIGKIYYNTTLNQLVFYDGTSWQKLPKSPM